MKYIFSTCLLSVVSVAYSQETLTTPTLGQRIEHLVEKLEAKRVEYNIPGMALAVVLDDKVVLEHSFGLSNLDEDSCWEGIQCFVCANTHQFRYSD